MKLKKYKVRRKITKWVETTVMAKSEEDVWNIMDKHEFEKGLEYDWAPSKDDNGCTGCEEDAILNK